MQDFLQMAAKQLGISEQSAGNAAGGLLNLAKKNLDGGQMSSLLGMLPGAGDWMSKAASLTGGGGGGGAGGAASGMLGKLGGMLGGAMGGKAGDALGLLGALQGAGLSGDKAGSFVSMFVNFIKSKGGEGIVQALMGKLPELAKLVK